MKQASRNTTSFWLAAELKEVFDYYEKIEVGVLRLLLCKLRSKDALSYPLLRPIRNSRYRQRGGFVRRIRWDPWDWTDRFRQNLRALERLGAIKVTRANKGKTSHYGPLYRDKISLNHAWYDQFMTEEKIKDGLEYMEMKKNNE